MDIIFLSYLSCRYRIDSALAYPVEECRDDARVDEVYEHGTDDRHDEEWLHCVVVLVADGTHVCHCVRRGSKTEAADT